MAFDLLQYMRGDGRLYELRHKINGNEGSQRVQTQADPSNSRVFYHVKNGEWERIYADDNFIYREADTSEAPDRYYVQTSNGLPGAVWCKRFMEVGEVVDRNPHVVHFFKANCAERIRGTHPSRLQLLKVHDSFTFAESQISLNDVLILGWINNDLVEEKYFYAKGFGLVGWEGRGRGHSFIAKIHQNQPDLQREMIPCLPLPNNLFFASKPVSHVRVITGAVDGLNVRTEPRVSGATLISTAKPGTVFEVVKQNPKWWQVILFNSENYFGGQVNAFVHGAFVEPHTPVAGGSAPPPPQPDEAEFVEIFGTGGTGLNVRTQPRVNKATRIATVREQTIFEVAAREGNWVQVVIYNGADFVGGRILAWVHHDFVRTIALPNGEPVEGKVINIVDILPTHATKQYGTRDLNGLDAHVVHHTAAPRSITPQRIAEFHVNSRDWPGIGYTFFIAADGRVFQTNHLETKSFATSRQNHRYLSTALSGDFREGRQPTPAQIKSLRWLHKEWIPSQLGRELPILGHQEGDGQATVCPGDSWDWHAAVS